MSENEIEFFIYNHTTIPMKRLQLQFNFNIETIKIYRKFPTAPIPSNVTGTNSNTIDFTFHGPIGQNENNIGIFLKGKSSSKARLEKLVWFSKDALPYELSRNEIDRKINSIYFP